MSWDRSCAGTITPHAAEGLELPGPESPQKELPNVAGRAMLEQEKPARRVSAGSSFLPPRSAAGGSATGNLPLDATRARSWPLMQTADRPAPADRQRYTNCRAGLLAWRTIAMISGAL